MTQLSELKVWLASIDSTRRVQLIRIAVISLLGAVFVALLSPGDRSSAAPDAGPSGDKTGLDTIVPAGHVLIPVEVVNAEAVDSILGSSAIVDLFTAGETAARRRIASSIALFRAPKNPKQFGILVPTEMAEPLMAEDARFSVAVASSKSNGSGPRLASRRALARASVGVTGEPAAVEYILDDTTDDETKERSDADKPTSTAKD